MITAGPTYEKIDPVRFIGNYSSGKMGYAIADAAAARGADVTLISGPVALKPSHSSVRVISVESAKEMLSACEKIFPQTDIAIMTAAVADYAPAEVYDRKIKREHDEVESIPLVKNPDIAATLGATKRPDQLLVGFALETDNEIYNACEKMNRKHLDMIVLNSLRDPGAGFRTDTNRITICYPDGTRKEYDLKPKTVVAVDIIDAISTLCEQA